MPRADESNRIPTSRVVIPRTEALVNRKLISIAQIRQKVDHSYHVTPRNSNIAVSNVRMIIDDEMI